MSLPTPLPTLFSQSAPCQRYDASFIRPKKQNSKMTTSQMTPGGVIATFFQVGCPPTEDRASLLPLNHAKMPAVTIAMPAATAVNKSYLPGTQKRALFATNNAIKLNRKSIHFIGKPSCCRNPSSRSSSSPSRAIGGWPTPSVFLFFFFHNYSRGGPFLAFFSRVGPLPAPSGFLIKPPTGLEPPAEVFLLP